MKIYKSKELVFVPNKYCNFGCKYCYLGCLTKETNKLDQIPNVLRNILNKYLEEGVVINSLALHGAEVTTLSKELFEEIFRIYFDEYSKKYETEIRYLSGRGPSAHIKTNLYLIDRHYDTLRKYPIIVSGSVDLPFDLHDKFRVLKNGKGTINKILDNIKYMLSDNDLKNSIQLSCTMGKEHYKHFDQFMNDIEYLDSIGFNVISKFYIMFIYDSVNSEIKQQLSQDEMVDVYKQLLKRFKGTKFEAGVHYSWFREFTHGYCTNCVNCSTRMNYLIQENGDVYPCHRSQPVKELNFGNIFKDGLKKVYNNSVKQMEEYENTNKNISKLCLKCEYFYICQIGCPITRKDTNSNRCYTCKLQKTIYKSQPKRFPPNKDLSNKYIDTYLRHMQPDSLVRDINKPRLMKPNRELFEFKNSLRSITNRDKVLQELYKIGNFMLVINNSEPIPLFSSNFYNKSINIELKSSDKIELLVNKEYFNFDIGIEEIDNERNYIVVDFLNNNMIVYGDEQRTKMTHYDDEVFLDIKDDLGYYQDYYTFDVTQMFKEVSSFFKQSTKDNKYPNMINFTSKRMRSYHYFKQSKNAFYHLEAINLPFHEFWFNYITE